MASPDGNGKIFNTGHLISLLLMAGMVSGVYATLRSQQAESTRAIDDIYKIVYDLKKDTQDWQNREAVYDVEIRTRLDALSNEDRAGQQRLSDRMNDLLLRMGAPPPRQEAK